MAMVMEGVCQDTTLCSIYSPHMMIWWIIISSRFHMQKPEKGIFLRLGILVYVVVH